MNAAYFKLAYQTRLLRTIEKQIIERAAKRRMEQHKVA